MYFRTGFGATVWYFHSLSIPWSWVWNIGWDCNRHSAALIFQFQTKIEHGNSHGKLKKNFFFLQIKYNMHYMCVQLFLSLVSSSIAIKEGTYWSHTTLLKLTCILIQRTHPKLGEDEDSPSNACDQVFF